MMENKEKYMPMLGRCISLCWASLVFMISSLVLAADQEDKVSTCSGIVLFCGFLILGMVVAIFSIFSWSAPIYFDDEKMEQKRFGKIHILYYNDIEFVKQPFKLISKLPVPVKICGKGKKFRIDVGTRCYRVFEEKIKDYPISKLVKKVVWNDE